MRYLLLFLLLASVFCMAEEFVFDGGEKMAIDRDNNWVVVESSQGRFMFYRYQVAQQKQPLYLMQLHYHKAVNSSRLPVYVFGNQERYAISREVNGVTTDKQNVLDLFDACEGLFKNYVDNPHAGQTINLQDDNQVMMGTKKLGLLERMMMPKRTENISLALNLQADASVILLQADASVMLDEKLAEIGADTERYFYHVSVNVFDDRGVPHEFIIGFVKNSGDQISVEVLHRGKLLSENNRLRFHSDGSEKEVTFSIQWLPLDKDGRHAGVSSQVIHFNVKASLLGVNSKVFAKEVDGYTPGFSEGWMVKDKKVIQRFSNKQTKTIAELTEEQYRATQLGECQLPIIFSTPLAFEAQGEDVTLQTLLRGHKKFSLSAIGGNEFYGYRKGFNAVLFSQLKKKYMFPAYSFSAGKNAQEKVLLGYMFQHASILENYFFSFGVPIEHDSAKSLKFEMLPNVFLILLENFDFDAANKVRR